MISNDKKMGASYRVSVVETDDGRLTCLRCAQSDGIEDTGSGFPRACPGCGGIIDWRVLNAQQDYEMVTINAQWGQALLGAAVHTLHVLEKSIKSWSGSSEAIAGAFEDELYVLRHSIEKLEEELQNCTCAWKDTAEGVEAEPCDYMRQNKPTCKVEPDVADANSLAVNGEFMYMDQKLNTNDLFSMRYVLSFVGQSFDRNHISDIDVKYRTIFGQNLVWHLPISPHTECGGAIVPVQEGFLYIPYKKVALHGGVCYAPNDACLLDAQGAAIIRNEHQQYADGLCSAMDDIVNALQIDKRRRNNV